MWKGVVIIILRQCSQCCHHSRAIVSVLLGLLLNGHRLQTKPTQLRLHLSACAIGCYSLHPPLPFVIVTQPKGDTCLTFPQRVVDWVDPGTVRNNLFWFLYCAVSVCFCSMFPISIRLFSVAFRKVSEASHSYFSVGLISLSTGRLLIVIQYNYNTIVISNVPCIINWMRGTWRQTVTGLISLSQKFNILSCI